jgi:hypothetical protein
VSGPRRAPTPANRMTRTRGNNDPCNTSELNRLVFAVACPRGCRASGGVGEAPLEGSTELEGSCTGSGACAASTIRCSVTVKFGEPESDILYLSALTQCNKKMDAVEIEVCLSERLPEGSVLEVCLEESNPWSPVSPAPRCDKVVAGEGAYTKPADSL